MKNLGIYLRERFPVGVTATHAFATAAMLVGIAAANQPLWNRFLSSMAVAVTFFFFMLRMRVTDEFKDWRHDKANYPNRPVQRGAITGRQLISIGVFALTVELIFAYGTGASTGHPASIGWHLCILGFSVLTHFEFFAKAFLERHFNLYFFLHQLIFVLYPVWLFAIWGTVVSWRTLAGAAAFVGYMAAMEVVRKYEIRRNPEGEIVLDTYLAVWKAGAFWAMFGITVCGSALLWFCGQNLWHLFIGALSAILLLLTKKRTDAVRGIVALGFILQSVVILLWN